MMNGPLVSVVIPTYKRPDTLDRAILSVLAQTYHNIEVIVVDDNNPNSEGRQLTEVKMSKFEEDSRVKYIKHEYNKNGSAARNTGARNSNAKYIAFLDDDDEFYPEKIEAQVKRLEELPKEYALCYTLVVYEKENGVLRYSKENREGDLFFDALTRNLSFQAGSNLFVRKDAFESIGGFDETFIRSQDKEVVTRLLKQYKIAFAPVIGVHAHVYEDHSFFDPIEVTDYYVKKMHPFVATLSDSQQAEFKKEMNKQRFYYALCMRKTGLAMLMLLSYKVTIKDAFRVISRGIRHKLHK